MFGRRWSAAEATIVEVNRKKTTGDGMVTIQEYLADIASETQPTFRTVVQEPGIATNFWPPSAGDVVGVLVHAKSQKVKFDSSDPKLDARKVKRAREDAFQQSASRPPGS